MSKQGSSRNKEKMKAESTASGTGPPSAGDEGNEEKVAGGNDVTYTAQTELSSTARILVLGPVIFTYFLWFLDLAVISTATPAITSQFNSLVDVGWYGGAYQLGSSAVTPLTGKLFRSFSIKWTFLTFFFIFEVGSTLCGAAQSSAMFIVGRTIAGIGASGISTGVLTIIAAILPGKAQAQVLGLTQGLGQIGLALGPIVGGALTEYVSWRWCFYINLPFGAVVGALLFLSRIPEPEPKKPATEVLRTAVKSLDLPGFLLISPAATMFLLALQFGGNEHPWKSSVVIGLIVGAAATFVCFLIWEKRQGDEAMVPFSLLTNKVIWSAAGNMAFVLASILVADFYLSIYFQAVKNDSPLMSGVHLLPTCLGIVLFTIISGVTIEKLGYYLPWAVTGSIISAIGYGLLSLLNPTTPPARWIGYQVFYGVGSGCTVVGVSFTQGFFQCYIVNADHSNHARAMSPFKNLVPAPQIPTAMAIVIFCQGMGGAVFLIVANAVFSNSLRRYLRAQSANIGVAPEAVVEAGARGLRKLIPGGEELTIVLKAYTDSIDNVMYVGVGVACAAFVFAWGLGFKDIRKVKAKENASTTDSAAVKEKDIEAGS